MRKLFYKIVLLYAAYFIVVQPVNAQKLGILNGAEFYINATYTDAMELTRFGSPLSDAVARGSSMGIMVLQSLEVGSSVAIESINGLSGGGVLFGFYSYYYPLQQNFGSDFTLGFGAAVKGVSCFGSYGGCVDTQRGSEASLSALASFALINNAISVIPSAELGITRSGWKIDNATLNASGSETYLFGLLSASLMIPGPTGTSFVVTPGYLVGTDDRRFNISLAFVVN